MKKILLISNMYPSKKFPHYGSFVKNTEDILIENGYFVRKVVLYKTNNKLKKLYNYIIFYLKTIFKGIFFSYDCLYAHYASHTALPLLIVKKLKPNLKIIMNVHGNDVVPEDDHDEKYIPMVKKILKQSYKIICPSMYFEEILKRDYLIPNNKIVVYPSSGIDMDNFKEYDKNNSKKQISLDVNYHYIGYISRIEKDKGWDLFLEAINKIKKQIPQDIKFLVIGSGSEEEKYNQLVKEYQLENLIIKKDFLPQSLLVYAYNSLEIFCFPTYRKSESLGLVGLEAMACKVPVIASDMGGPKTYIKSYENGFLFETQNSDDLAKKILEVLNYSDLKEIKNNAYQTAMKYDKNVIKNILIDIFSQI